MGAVRPSPTIVRTNLRRLSVPSFTRPINARTSRSSIAVTPRSFPTSCATPHGARSSVAPRAELPTRRERRQDPRAALGAEGFLLEPRAERRRLLDRPLRDHRAHADSLGELPVREVAEQGDPEPRDRGGQAVLDPRVG